MTSVLMVPFHTVKLLYYSALRLQIIISLYIYTPPRCTGGLLADKGHDNSVTGKSGVQPKAG